MFGDKNKSPITGSGRLTDFAYLSDSDVYLDTACQCLRPQPVLNALNDYYTHFNACGDRVKYKWGIKVDETLEAAREAVLGLLRLPAKDYVCSFTLNTSYGINLILSQLPAGQFDRVVTSEIEHNSVFLPTMELAKRLGVERLVLPRAQDGSLQYSLGELAKAVVVVNAVSNIDGRRLENLPELIKDTHENGGIVILDAAQAVANYHRWLAKCGADAICFSAHKLYSSTLGVIAIRQDLIKQLSTTFIGGGMVTSVNRDSYQLLPNELHTRLEPGLQAYGEITALNAAISWLQAVQPFGQDPGEYIQSLSTRLFDGLKSIGGINIFNNSVTPVISIYPKKGDAHRLAIFLSAAGIMARSGSFCCHHYLDEVTQTPPLLRLSLGLHNTVEDIDKTLVTLAKITKG